MTHTALPDDTEPLNALGYFQESLTAWAEFSQRTQQIVMDQANRLATAKPSDDENPAETLTNELMRSLADLNLRHWQNTARLLDSFPSWMTTPAMNAGVSLTDLFDSLQRGKTGFAFEPGPAAATTPAELGALAVPSDDLTRIKGIGPKLSEKLNELGVSQFRQIAGWDETTAERIEDEIAFKGKVRREDWVGQARKLMANGSAELH